MRYLLLAPIFLLAGCGDTSHKGGIPQVQEGERFNYKYHGSLRCGPADRENYRAIYTIVDTTTGVEYLAVQGLGTSQLVTERQGKHSVTVER